MRVSFLWRMGVAALIGFALGGGLTTMLLVPHLKPEVTISQIYKRKIKISDEGTFDSTMNVDDITQEETKNKKNRVRRRDR